MNISGDRLRRKLVLLVVALLLAPLAITVGPTAPARAEYATGGSGRFLKEINWFVWGAHNATIPNTGIAKTNTFDLGGVSVDVTCTLSNLKRPRGTSTQPFLSAYRPGAWGGDGLDDLYNIGGTGANNRLISGLANTTNGELITFDFSCTAASGGRPVQLGGLVMADAEQSGQNEYISATIPSNATWRIIDRYRAPATCTQSSVATRTGTTLALGSNLGVCPGGGPMAIAYMDGTSSATAVTVAGGGKSAIALGVMLTIDRSDAPASFGGAPHVLNPNWTGGEPAPVGPTQVNDPAFTLASLQSPTPRLGQQITADSEDLSGPGADQDVGDDGVTFPETISTAPAGRFEAPVTCVGSGAIRGWIDWNLDGTFQTDAAAGEQSDQTSCLNGQATLVWPRVGPDVRSTASTGIPGYARVRITPPGTTPTPTGLVTGGEVEDYRMNIQPSETQLIKAVDGRVSPQDQFKVSQRDAASPEVEQLAATTTGSQTRVSTSWRAADTGVTYVLRDEKAAGPTGLAEYRASIRCVNLTTGADYPTSGTGPQWQISNLPAGARIQCEITNQARQSALTLDKRATTVGNAAGQPVRYEFVVTNTGDTDLSQVAVSDNKIGSVTCPATTLAAKAAMTCTATYSLTQADVDAGTVVNTASVTGTSPGGTTATASDTEQTAVTATSGIQVTKSHNVPAGQRVKAGDTIGYSFRVRNTGAVTLSNVAVNDPKVGAVSCPATTLAPGAETTCTASYLVTQADVDAGRVTNSATASGDPAGGRPRITSAASTAEVLTADRAPAVAFTKVAARPGKQPTDPIVVGDQISYSFTVRNSGNVTVDQVAISDPMITSPITCQTTTLAPGATTSCTTTFTRTVTQADVDSGAVSNTATVTGNTAAGPVRATASTTTPSEPQPALTLTKQTGLAEGTRVRAGDQIPYRFVVRNSGNVTISALAIEDDRLPQGASCPATRLAPNEETTCTARTPYTVTQADVDSGRVTNAATATGSATAVPSVRSNVSRTTVLATDPNRALRLTKTAALTDTNGNGGADVGERIDYRFEAENTGDVSLTITIDDPRLPGGVNCPAEPVAPGGKITCTAAPYTVTQADVDAGAVTNRATATGTGRGGTATASAEASVATVAADAKLTFTKSGTLRDRNGNGTADVGEVIGYSFTVTNSGNVTLTDLAVSDPRVASVNCPVSRLAPGASATCTADYTVTQSDLDAGQVTRNTATAKAATPGGGSVGAEASAEVANTAAAPGLSVVKVGDLDDANGNGVADLGEQISWRIAVNNSGNVTITDLGVSDPKAGAVRCDRTGLGPGETAACTAGPYTVTQADLDAGEVRNVATASGTPARGSLVPASGSSSTPVTAVSGGLGLVKRAELVDGNGNGTADVGEVYRYTFEVTNNRNVTVEQLSIDDAQAAPVSCAVTRLAPATKTVCRSADFTVTQEQIESGNGVIANTAVARGIDTRGTGVDSEPSTATIPVTGRSAAVVLVKDAQLDDGNGNGFADLGESIEYRFVVTNQGNVVLSDVAVDDPKLGAVSCMPDQLAPGQSVTCTAAAYPVTQDDVDAGAVVNIATVTAQSSAGEVSDADTRSVPVQPFDPDSALTLTKQGNLADANGNGSADVGERIAYTFTVRNDSSRTLSEIAVSDPKVGQVTCDPTTLAPGASVTCTAAAYTVTQADVDAGEVRNQATATGSTPQEEQISASAEHSIPTVAAAGALTLTKTADLLDPNGNGVADLGEQVNYSFTLANTGNVTLTEIAVNDPKTGAVACRDTSLAPGAATTCTAAAYTVTQDDLDAEAVRNSATATATTPDGTVVTAQDTATVAVPGRTGALTATKGAALTDRNGNGTADTGETIDYTFTVRNDSNRTLDQLQIDDPKIDGAITCDPTTLAPGASATCTAAAYTVTQADVDAGAVRNTATASGVTPAGERVSGEGSATVPASKLAGGLGLTKIAQLRDANGNARADVGETIDYRFVVRNTSNLTVSGIGIDDPKLGTVTCPATALPPNAELTCTGAPYTVTQADLDRGAVDNTARATGRAADGTQLATDAGASVPTIDRTPGIAVTKSGVLRDGNGNGTADVGEQIDYSFTVANTGNVTVTDLVVSDPRVGAVTCRPTTLAPGATATCTAAAYRVSQADVDAGEVRNRATATGQTFGGGAVTDSAEQVIPATALPADAAPELTKTGVLTDANGNGSADVGEQVDYTFTVGNGTNRTMSELRIDDPKAGEVVCPTRTLAPGATSRCTARYTVTQADVDAGVVLNTATATAQTSAGERTSKPATSRVPTTEVSGGLDLRKTAALVDSNGNETADAGELIRYTFEVTNRSNVTLRAVRIEDARVSGLSCPDGELAPGASVTCTADPYQVTEEDRSAGPEIVNTATASADAGDRRLTSAPASARVPVTGAGNAARLGLVKDGELVDRNQNRIADQGEVINYRFTITNDSDLPVSEIAVSDPKLGEVRCPATALAAGQSMVCTASYTATAEDVASGAVHNQAQARGVRQGSVIRSEMAENTITSTTGDPVLTLTKTAQLTDPNRNGVADLDETVGYTFTVRNGGNVPLRQIQVHDPKLGEVRCPRADLEPGESMTCTAADYRVTQQDLDSGVVANSATATALDPDGQAIATPAAQVLLDTAAREPGIRLQKVGSLADRNGNRTAEPGERIDYRFEVANTGNVTLRQVRVEDPMLGRVLCPATELAPGARKTCTAAAYRVTAADGRAGVVLNQATAVGTAADREVRAEDSVRLAATDGRGGGGGGGGLSDTGSPLSPVLLLAGLVCLLGGVFLVRRQRDK